MQTFDILLKINIVLVLFYGRVLTIRTRVGTIQTNNNVMDGVNLRTEAKRIIHGQYKVLTSCQLLNNAKKFRQKFRCKLSYLHRLMKFSRNFEKLIQENVDFRMASFCEQLGVTTPGSVLHMYLSVHHTVFLPAL